MTRAEDLTAGALLPCPFCGGEAEIVSKHYVQCSSMDCYPINKMPIQQWNKRAGLAAMPDHSAELLETLKEVSEWISGWSPNFIYDDEWPSTAAKINAAIAKARGET